MTCPRCEEGVLVAVKFTDGRKGQICKYCEALWFDGEVISESSAHALQQHTHPKDLEYSVEEDDDEEDSSVEYVKYR